MIEDVRPEDLVAAFIHNSAIGVVIADQEDRILLVNEVASELFGWPTDVAEWTARLVDLFPKRLSEENGQFLANLQSIGTLEIAAEKADGKEIWVEATISTFESNGMNWRLGLFRDLSSQVERESKLHQAAITDSLSGLLNRGEFQRVLEASIGQPLALAIIDIDHFKSINDCFGHPVGDQMIERIGAILESVFEGAIAISRLGGDEFGVLFKVDPLKDVVDNRFSNLQSELVAVSHDRDGFDLTTSIGVAVDSSGFATPRELLSKADNAMYDSKRAGRNQATVIQLGEGE